MLIGRERRGRCADWPRARGGAGHTAAGALPRRAGVSHEALKRQPHPPNIELWEMIYFIHMYIGAVYIANRVLPYDIGGLYELLN